MARYALSIIFAVFLACADNADARNRLPQDSKPSMSIVDGSPTLAPFQHVRFCLESGLPAKALRLSVFKTSSGIGHLVLVVITTKGDMVLDNLTEAIRPWQSTDYHWLKIQAANDAGFWYEVKALGTSVSQADRKVLLADR